MLDALYHSLDPVAFAVGPFVVRWYGLAYLLGFVCVGLVMWNVSRRWKVGMSLDSLLTVMLGIVVGVIVGARLGYVLFYGSGYYLEHPLDVFALQQGGMSFHGGLIGAVVSGLITSRMVGVPFATLADLGAIGAPIGLFFGRCANFVNGELWGSVTDLPWGVVFGGAAGDLPRHPSQLYEALLEGVLMFVVLYALARKLPPRPRGTFIGLFLLLYGICRFLIEFVRQPDAHIGYLAGGWLTMGQVLSLPLVLAGIAMLIWAARMNLEQRALSHDEDAVE